MGHLLFSVISLSETVFSFFRVAAARSMAGYPDKRDLLMNVQTGSYF
jgi:hypothetical protein